MGVSMFTFIGMIYGGKFKYIKQFDRDFRIRIL